MKPVEFELLMRAPYEAISKIHLIIDPTVSPKDVAEYYGNIRRQLIGGRHRGLTVKHLNLAHFRSRNSGLKPAELLTKWNDLHGEENPDWCYDEGDVRNFGRDCNRAEDRLLHPKFSITV